MIWSPNATIADKESKVPHALGSNGCFLCSGADAEMKTPLSVAIRRKLPKLDNPTRVRFDGNLQRCQPRLRQCRHFDDTETLVKEGQRFPQTCDQRGRACPELVTRNSVPTAQ
jgi:hypothetical protein